MKIKRSTSILMLIMSVAIVCLSFGMFSFKFSKNSQALKEEIANAVSANGGAMYIGAGSKVTLGSDCTISGITGVTRGGAIYVAGELTIDGATISNCSAQYGGAIYIASSGKVTMNSGEIFSCTASSGGAIFIASGGTFEFKDGEIYSCQATDNGGAVYSSYGTMTMSGGSFDCNNSTYNGGAVYSDGGNLTITGGSFSENSTDVSGGAIYSYGVNLKIQGTSTNKIFFGRNETLVDDDIYAGGGAICIYDEDYGDNMAFAEMKYVDFQENRTPSNGGDINIGFLGGYDYSFANCTFKYSTAVGYGGAISTTGENIGDSDICFTDCSFLNCTAQSDGGAISDQGEGNTEIIMNRSQFEKCTTAISGGAISAGDVVINDGAFIECSADENGGAINCFGILDIHGELEVNFSECQADLSGCDCSGGAIYFWGGEIKIQNSAFNNCTSYYAGAIYIYSGATGSSINAVSINNCDQYENGAVWINSGSVTMYDVGFIGCDSSDGSGGAISVSSSVLNVEGGLNINTCYSSYDGGAIHVSANGTISFDYSVGTGNIITSCEAAGNGGAIYISGNSEFAFGQEAYLEIFDCYAENGAGIYFQDRTTVFDGNLYETTISECTADSQGNGGGVYIGDGLSLECIHLTISDCSAGMGGGIYAAENSSFSLSGCEISSNTGDSSYGANIHFEGGPQANGTLDIGSGAEIYSPIGGYNIFIYDMGNINISSGAVVGTANPASNDRIYGYEREAYLNCSGGTIYSILDINNAYFSFNPTNTITCSSYQTIDFSSSSYIQLSDFVCENVTYGPYQSGTTVSFKKGASISVRFYNSTEDRVTVQTPDGTFHSFDAGNSYSYNGAGGNFGVTCYNFSTTFKIQIDSRQSGVIGYIYSDSSASSGSGSTILNLTASDDITFTMIRANAVAPGGVDNIPEKDLQEKLFYAPNADEYYAPEKNIQTNMSLSSNLSINDEEKYVVKANRLKIA